MKLLFDHNISYLLIHRIEKLFPKSQHVRALNLHKAEDQAIWEYAEEHHFTIISKDQDFHQLSFLYGAPPKVVWLRLGNCTTQDIEKALIKYYQSLLVFDKDKNATFIIIGEN